MRLGLLRHFPVTLPFPSGWRTSTDLQVWLDHYDRAPITPGPSDLGGVPWQVCLTSDLPRALATARAVFPGQVEPTELLREARFLPFATGSLRLPVWTWYWWVRICWMTGHRSQRPCRDEFRIRVRTMANRLSQATQDTLVVSHAGMMAYLSTELRQRGFVGPRLKMAQHARAYLYQRA
ncbi:MAG: histidine phosphatase family protein [Verrucomicrobiales bacterium]|nr:histidine phosphatase family protein [Verrucomicrobiales bacterium]